MKNVFAIVMAVLMSSIALPESNAQWVRQNSGSGTRLTDVVMLNASTAIAVGRNGSILRTTNSGAVWIDVAAPLSFIQPWNAVSFFDTSHGIVAGDHGVVLTTTNGGKNWMWHVVPGDRTCLSVLAAGPGTMYVGTDSGWVFNTSDTGRTWGAEKISRWPIRSLFSFRGLLVSGVANFALTPYSFCTQYFLFTHPSTPSPPWDEKVLQEFQGLGSEAFDAEFCNGGIAGFIVGVQGDLRAAPTILRKMLPDTVWHSAATGVARDGTFFGVSAPSASVVYVCGSGGMIYKSSNGGETWIDQTVKTARDLNAIFFYDENHGIAVGDSGVILYTSNGGLTGVAEPDGPRPEKFYLEQNYPNPVNPSTTITYSLPSGFSGRVTLRVYDLLGREVATLVDEVKQPGVYSHQWNAVGKSSTVYFYRLHAGGNTAVKKMSVIK